MPTGCTEDTAKSSNVGSATMPRSRDGPVRDLPPRPVTVLVAGDDDREDTKQLLRELTHGGLRASGGSASAEEAALAPAYAIVSMRALGELAELRHDAFYDTLTGLANRALFNDRLAVDASRARAGRATSPFTRSCSFDVDRFKWVNESWATAPATGC